MAFNCLENCGECCGMVAFPLEVWLKHKDKAINPKVFNDGQEVYATQKGKLICTFLDENKKCLIYEDRPKTCKDYGLIPQLECPYLRPDGAVRIRQERRKVQRKIDKGVDKAMECMKRMVERT